MWHKDETTSLSAEFEAIHDSGGTSIAIGLHQGPGTVQTKVAESVNGLEVVQSSVAGSTGAHEYSLGSTPRVSTIRKAVALHDMPSCRESPQLFAARVAEVPQEIYLLTILQGLR
jgi:hypothetical protein